MNAQEPEKEKIDTGEFDYPETVYVRDIETRVFQSIVLQTLSKIEGISLLEGNFFDSLLRKASVETPKGIYVEQNDQNQGISVKIEVDVGYGVAIPQKAEEIQTLISGEIIRLTGLHVNKVHVIFKNMVLITQTEKIEEILGEEADQAQAELSALFDEEKESKELVTETTS